MIDLTPIQKVVESFETVPRLPDTDIFPGLSQLKKPLRRAFLILGAEGSGTYMMAEALVAAGCYYNTKHEFNLGDFCKDWKFDQLPSPLVMRRSYPHAGEEPMVFNIINCLRNAGFDVYVIAIFRDYYATMKSVMRRDPERHPLEIMENQRMAFIKIAELVKVKVNRGKVSPQTSIDRLHFTYITYEAFVGSEGFRNWLFARLKLPYPEDFEVRNENDKHYLFDDIEWESEDD